MKIQDTKTCRRRNNIKKLVVEVPKKYKSRRRKRGEDPRNTRQDPRNARKKRRMQDNCWADIAERWQAVNRKPPPPRCRPGCGRGRLTKAPEYEVVGTTGTTTASGTTAVGRRIPDLDQFNMIGATTPGRSWLFIFQSLLVVPYRTIE